MDLKTLAERIGEELPTKELPKQDRGRGAARRLAASILGRSGGIRAAPPGPLR